MKSASLLKTHQYDVSKYPRSTRDRRSKGVVCFSSIKSYHMLCYIVSYVNVFVITFHMSSHKLSHVISTYHILSCPMLYHDGPGSLSNALFTDDRQLSKATMFPCVPEDDQNFPYMVVQRDTHVPYRGPNVLTVFAKNTTEKGKKSKNQTLTITKGNEFLRCVLHSDSLVFC